MVQISLQNSGGKMVFSGGFHGTPLGTNRSKSTLLSVGFSWMMPFRDAKFDGVRYAI